MENENENENVNKDINEDRVKGVVGEKGKETHTAEVFPTFNDIWDVYDHKVNRKAAETAFKRLRQAEREAAYTKVPEYIKSLSDRKFQAHLATWLNGRRWEDEYQPFIQKRNKNAPATIEQVSANLEQALRNIAAEHSTSQ